MKIVKDLDLIEDTLLTTKSDYILLIAFHFHTVHILGIKWVCTDTINVLLVMKFR